MRRITLVVMLITLIILPCIGQAHADTWASSESGSIVNEEDGSTVTYDQVLLSQKVEYTGNPIKPRIRIDGLSEDVDYAVAYKNNIEPGVAKVVIVGIGKYSGTINRTFKIVSNIGNQIACRGETVLYGSYPQTEIVAEAAQSGVYEKSWAVESDYIVDSNLYNRLSSATWKNNEVVVDGQKYKRIRRTDATFWGKSATQMYSLEWHLGCHYTWSNATTYHYFRYEPIKWRILEKNEETLFLVADVALDNQYYQNGVSTWANSSIRTWLNDDFYNKAFSDNEQRFIKTSHVEAIEDDLEGTETEDKVFLLSSKERDVDGVTTAYNRNAVYMCGSSTYAKAMGAFAIKNNGGPYATWWLRSRAQSAPYYADYAGRTISGTSENISARAVRPAMRVSLVSNELISDTSIAEFTNAYNACPIPSYFVYDGTPKEPEVSVGNLEKGKDYEVTYRYNINAGTAYADITGIGDYTGEISQSFQIKKKPITDYEHQISGNSFVYTGKEIRPSISFIGLEEKYYNVTYSDNINVGTATVKATAKSSGNYTGAVSEVFDIEPLNIENTTVKLAESVVFYDGTAQEPTVVIPGLEQGIDFVCEYTDNIEAGTGHVKITGIGNCVGTVEKTFEIKVLATSVNIDDKELVYGDKDTLDLKYFPDNSISLDLPRWSSDNTSVVKVDSKGGITAEGIGTATISVSVGDLSDSATITVNKAIPSYSTPSSVHAGCEDILSSIKLPTGFEWEDGSLSVGKAGIKEFVAAFTPDDKEHYMQVTGINIKVEVNHKYSTKWLFSHNTHWYECVCGEKSLEAEHSYGEWTVKTEASCTTDGLKEKVCSVCGYKVTKEIPATGHLFADEFTVDIEPTCTAEGFKSRHCTNCDEVTSVTAIPAKGHSWKTEPTVDKEATCTEEGSQSIHCSVCDAVDESKVTVIPAKDHSFGDWVEVTPSTCEDSGLKQHTCDSCGFVESENLNPKGHDWESDFTVDVEATCTTDGSKSIHCKNCEAISDSTVILAAGHSYGEWKTTKEPTCIETGLKEKLCSACGDKVTETLPIVDHSWNANPTVDKEATCTEEGSRSIHCSVCGIKDESTVTVIPKTDHTYGAWKVKKEATCTEDGFKERVCSVCDNTITEAIKTAGHKWNTEYTVDKKATYAAAGSESIHCSVCDAKKPNSAVSISKLKLATPAVSKPTAAKKGFTVKWKKVSAATGYQVQYALNSKFTKSKKTVKITKAATVSKKVTKLKAKKKYYVRVRAYKVVSGKTYYSTWSKYKTVTKKK